VGNPAEETYRYPNQNHCWKFIRLAVFVNSGVAARASGQGNLAATGLPKTGSTRGAQGIHLHASSLQLEDSGLTPLANLLA
jgi:hypothetical protein